MESTEFRLRLPWTLLLQVILLLFSTRNTTLGQEAALGENCAGQGTCLDQNAVCNGTCQCIGDYYNSSNSCVLTAANLVSLLVVAPQTQPGVLFVSWVPGERTANASYNISWAEETSIGSNRFVYKGSEIVYGYQQQNYTITGLLSYWNHNVSVRPFTEIGPSPKASHTVARTTDSVPGKVDIFTIYQPEASAQELVFTVSCPAERQRNGNITFFVLGSTHPDNKTVGQVEVNDSCARNYTFTALVTAEFNYTFTASASTSRFKGASVSIWWHVAPRPPKLSPISGFDASLLKAPAANETTQTTAVLKICPCLIDMSQGAVILAGLIICSNKNSTCNIPPSEVITSSFLLTWKKFRDNGYKGIYRPTPDDWPKLLDFASSSSTKRSAMPSRSIRETVSEITYTLGSDDSCEQQNNSVYCNGPLPPGTTLVIKAFACTGGGCSAASSDITIITTSKNSIVDVSVVVWDILGAIGFVVVCIVAFVVSLVLLRRRKRLPDPKPQESPSVSLFQIQGESQRYTNLPSRETFRLPDLTPQNRPSVPLFHFDEYLRQMHLDANRRFKLEFSELHTSHGNKAAQFTMRAGNEPLNFFKNRSQDVVPYDHNRVVLSGHRESTQDYINASYVQGSDSPCGYIATQGPLYSTLSDFWKMICEQRSGVIVMLCDCIEDGKKTVDKYWPDKIYSPLRHGDVTVTMTDIFDFNVYTLRKMTVRMSQREDLQITQLCVRGWSESVCILPFEKLIEIIRLVRQTARHSNGPITVHCNLGIGRTGVFIALDLLTRFVDEHDLATELNVYTVVQRMLGCRPNIIQTLDQYIFIHDVLRVIIAEKMRTDSARGTSVANENLGDTENDYERIYSIIPDEHTYCTLEER